MATWWPNFRNNYASRYNLGYSDWERWFAWHPVKVNGQRVWLQLTYRRTRVTFRGSVAVLSRREYGDVFEILKTK